MKIKSREDLTVSKAPGLVSRARTLAVLLKFRSQALQLTNYNLGKLLKLSSLILIIKLRTVERNK